MSDTVATRQERALRALGALSNRRGELRAYLNDVANAAAALTEADWVAVTLCADGYERVLASTLGPSDDQAPKAIHGEVTDIVARTGCVLVVEDSEVDSSSGKMPFGYRAYLGVPLRTWQGDVLGTVCSFSREPRRFDEEDCRVAVLLAERAATAIDNFRLHEELSATNARLEGELARRTEEIRAAHERLAAQAQLAAIGEFTAMVVHEVRDPLGVIVLALSAVARMGVPDAAVPALRSAEQEAARLERMLLELLLFAKPQTLRFESVDIVALSRDVARQLEALSDLSDRSIQVQASREALWVRGDPDKLRQVVTNVFRNAMEASPAGDTVRCSISAPEGRAVLRVVNGGPRIPPEDLPRLTEPFFTTKTGGTGLGLALVLRIVQDHGGTLQIESDDDAGTRVTVTLPR